MSSRHRFIVGIFSIGLIVSLVWAGRPIGEDVDRPERALRRNALPVGPGGLRAPREAFPGQAAYRAELTKAEKQYVERVKAARQKYIAAIKDFQMRATMMREQAQKIEAEVKRITNLPDPIVIPEPVADDGGAADSQKVTVAMKAPNGLWSIKIQDVRLVDGELWVLSKLTAAEGMGIMMIIDVTDSVTVPASAKTVRHFAIGKTWNWDDEGSTVKHVKDEAALGKKWAAAKSLKLKR